MCLLQLRRVMVCACSTPRGSQLWQELQVCRQRRQNGFAGWINTPTAGRRIRVDEVTSATMPVFGTTTTAQVPFPAKMDAILEKMYNKLVGVPKEAATASAERRKGGKGQARPSFGDHAYACHLLEMPMDGGAQRDDAERWLGGVYSQGPDPAEPSGVHAQTPVIDGTQWDSDDNENIFPDSSDEDHVPVLQLRARAHHVRHCHRHTAPLLLLTRTCC